MRVLIIGNGAREDALSWALQRSPSTTAVFASPGNAGTASRGENWGVPVRESRELVRRAQEAKIDLVVVGPETAIAAGVCDTFRDAGFAVFGPSRSIGRLETSKIFAKRFMEKHQIPTARFAAVHSVEMAKRALENWRGGCVVKADGLAAGKGVVVTDSAADALTILEKWYGTNSVPGGGTAVVLEERLSGRELSVFAVGDGRKLEFFAAACDYKRAGDGDVGPNTGGMGAYSPPIGFPENYEEIVKRDILAPMLKGLAAEREPYCGVLYCGLMWTAAGPRVIEFNVRFGDPETQVIMPRVTGDLALYLRSAAIGKLDSTAAAVSNAACVGVVLATKEYPIRSTPIGDLPADVAVDGGQAFWGGCNRNPATGHVDALGGRVLTVAALGGDLGEARDGAYAAVRTLADRFGRRDLSFRTDIGLVAVPAAT